MIIYSNGCSHTYGHCVGIENSYPSLVMKNKCESFFSHTSNTEQFKIEDIKHHDNILINESRCGAGNDYIFHKSLESINKLIIHNKKPSYIIIQWSGPNRRLHCDFDGNYLNVNNFDNVEYFVKFEPMGSEHTLHYMFSLQQFLKNNNIRYNFINYFSLDESIKNLSIYNEIDFENIIDFGFGNEILTKGILEHIKNKKLSCDDLGHPNESGYLYITNEILKRI